MKTYETPEIELIRFQTEDIITGSPTVLPGQDTGDGNIEKP